MKNLKEMPKSKYRCLFVFQSVIQSVGQLFMKLFSQ